MSWLCNECGETVGKSDTEQSYIHIQAFDTGWLCGECKDTVNWKQHLDHFDEDGEYTGS